MFAPRTVSLFALLAAVGLAAPAVARAEVKLGYVDLQRALNEVEEGKVAKAALKTEFDQKQKTLDERKTEFEKARADFEKQASVMSEDARKQKQGELERKGMELQSFFMQQQKELAERERETTRGIFEKMQGIVREIADADGLSAVVQSEALVYAAPSLDITNELVRKYNARYKAGSAPAAKADKAGAAGAKSDKADKKASAKKESK